jgi:hypothetical protein
MRTAGYKRGIFLKEDFPFLNVSFEIKFKVMLKLFLNLKGLVFYLFFSVIMFFLINLYALILIHRIAIINHFYDKHFSQSCPNYHRFINYRRLGF